MDCKLDQKDGNSEVRCWLTLPEKPVKPNCFSFGSRHKELYSKVAMNANFKNLSENNHDNEVNRLLIWIAIATRQLLDIRNHAIGALICGQYCNNFPHTGYNDLTFRTACNAIIHAVEILSYDPDDEESTPEGTWKADYYKGTTTIRGRRRGRRGQQATRALLDCEKFVEYCILLSEEFIVEV